MPIHVRRRNRQSVEPVLLRPLRVSRPTFPLRRSALPFPRKVPELVMTSDTKRELGTPPTHPYAERILPTSEELGTRRIPPYTRRILLTKREFGTRRICLYAERILLRNNRASTRTPLRLRLRFPAGLATPTAIGPADTRIAVNGETTDIGPEPNAA